MTRFEKSPLKLAVGEEVKTYDDGTDGYPAKWVNGIVTEIGDNSFAVLWDDFKDKGWETEYEWGNVYIEGNTIYENGVGNKRANILQASQPKEDVGGEVLLSVEQLASELEDKRVTKMMHAISPTSETIYHLSLKHTAEYILDKYRITPIEPIPTITK